jgi:transposase
MPSPKLAPLLLSGAERESLEALARKRTASQSLVLRARIVLACAEDGGVAPLTAVAAATGVSRESVRKWRVRFMEQRLGGLADAPRPGAPRKITDDQVEVVITRVLTEKGRGQDTHWTTRSMAGETGLSQRHRARNRHPQVDQRVEQGPQAVHVDQIRRRHPRNPRRLLPANSRLRTTSSAGERTLSLVEPGEPTDPIPILTCIASVTRGLGRRDARA